MLAVVTSGYWIIEWSLFSSFLYFQIFFSMKIYYFCIREKQKMLFFKKKSALGRFIHSPSKKPLGNACYPTIQIQILMCFVRTGPRNWNSDERRGKERWTQNLNSLSFIGCGPDHLIPLCCQSSCLSYVQNASALPGVSEREREREELCGKL